MYSDSYCASHKIISLGPARSMETISQKKDIFPMKNNSGHFFSYYRVWQTSGNILLGSIRYYGNRCASYKIISVTPNKLLKTQFFEKKAIFPAKKFFRPTFSCIIE